MFEVKFDAVSNSGYLEQNLVALDSSSSRILLSPCTLIEYFTTL